VKLLFYDHKDLAEEFTHFLSVSTSSAIVPHLQASGRVSFEPTLGLTSVRHLHEEIMVKQKQQSATSNKVEKERDFKEGWQWKQEDMGEKSSAQTRKGELNIMNLSPLRRNSTGRSRDLICRQRQKGSIDGSTGQHSQQCPPTDHSKTLRLINPHEELIFFEKVNIKTGNDNASRELLRCINMYKDGLIGPEHFPYLAVNILGKYPDIMNEFIEMVSQSGNWEHSELLTDMVLREEECTEHVQIGKGTENIDIVLQEERGLDIVLEKENERKKEKDHEEDRDGHKDQHHRSRVTLDSNSSPSSNNEKLTYKPISEMDLSQWDRCTPSYRLLPQNFLKPVASYCTALAAEVLNDTCVAVASGTEDYPKHVQENCYEEALFRCEEDRFELDMLIETTIATIKCIHELLEKMHNNTINESGHIQTENHLTAMNLRCIERIYGDHGLDVICLVHETPGQCLPVIVKRLQQKHDEWSNCRIKFNRIWADVCAKNYTKSLDHRSSFFEQQDEKSLSQKALLQDIKEISERKSKEIKMLVTIASGNGTPLIPDLKYKYTDMTLHEDLYKIIKYSSDKVCTSTKGSDKIMRIFTIFFEQMLGFPSQSNGVKDTEEDLSLAQERNWKSPELGHGELGIDREEGELSPHSHYEAVYGGLDCEREGELSPRLTLFEQISSTKRNALAAERNWENVKDRLPPKLEKLTIKLVEQLQTIALGEMEKELLKLGLYERWRSPSSFSDVVYHANASNLLKRNNVYRFEFASQSDELSIQLMRNALGKLDCDAKELEPAFLDYLQNDFFSTVSDAKERHQIFLSRNMCKYTSVDKYYDSMSNVMKDVRLVNGLQQIISCKTSKVGQVLSARVLLLIAI
ncbi:hypothetical protein KI387_030423, partial [Taxus chinensis]